MTREEEISNAIDDFLNKEDLTCLSCSAYSFKKGAEWADKHSKSPWISVKDDLPCNHEELISEKFNSTKKLITRDDENNFYLQRMEKLNGFWKWEFPANITHWMLIPKLSIEKFLANTKVYAAGKSMEIQKKLYSFGYRRNGYNVEIYCTQSPFIYISEDKYIMYGDNMDDFIEHPYNEISADEILALELDT